MKKVAQFLAASMIFVAVILPVSAQEIELPQGFATQDETTTLDYPEDWFAAEPTEFPAPIILLTNQESYQDLSFIADDQATIETGTIAVLVWMPITFEMLEFEPSEDFAENTELLMTTFENDSSLFVEREESIEGTLGEHDTITVAAHGEGFDSNFLFLNIEGNFLLVLSLTAPEEYADFAPTVEAIAASINYAIPVEKYITFESEEYLVTFDYPESWKTQESLGYISLASNPRLFNSEVTVSGTILIGFFEPTALEGLFRIDEPAFDETTLSGLIEIFGDPESIDEPEEFELNGYPAMSQTLTTHNTELRAVLIDFDGQLIGFMATTPPDELDNWTEQIELILDSIALAE